MSDQPAILKTVIAYDATGAIKHVTTVPENVAELQQAPDGCTLLITDPTATSLRELFQTNWISNGVVTAKQSMSPIANKTAMAANGEDTVFIVDLPKPVTIRITGSLEFGPAEVTDGRIDLTVDHPGALVITATSEPGYIPWSVTINAT